MPGGDRTGPWREGSMTGRGAGFCGGFGVPGFMNPVSGGRRPGRMWRKIGFGPGWGGGFRNRGWFRGLFCWRGVPYFRGRAGLLSPSDEKAFLQNELKLLNEEMSAIKERLEQLEKSSENDR